ncbi:glycoside hydrolase family 18 protein [Undibacterium sp. Jales W-56]|uniref:glycoside hydrolase family 18 protein n=1 Tax=Undibacterium sp. Jales W-56 TaxID=2897325 RepID=UPI0021D36A05|nr:glycoside hydrolase family 18 protein [Undibacterium sp. Jales W-56]MCU6434275.1 glycoside hydrolase family 18 protein [Undibacterium sp. Jales W-56]
MQQFLLSAALISATFISAVLLPLASFANKNADSHVVIGYYLLEKEQINHYPEAAEFPVVRITPAKAAMLTHINFSFININPAGECDLPEGVAADKAALVFRELMALKKYNPRLRILFSVGGWAYSNDSSPTVNRYRDAVSTPESRRRLATSCIAFMRHYAFDGIDIDWEYPRPQDAGHFVALLTEIRRQLTQENLHRAKKPYQLTIAGPGDTANMARYYPQLLAIVEQLDYINLMSYDLNGVWQKLSNHNAHLFGDPGEPLIANPLRNLATSAGMDQVNMEKLFPSPLANTVDAAVKQYLRAGVPASKMVLGMPFYGRAFFQVTPKNRGLYQSFVTESAENYQGDPSLLIGCDACTQRKEPRMASYAEIQAMLKADLGYVRYFSRESKVPWLWHPEKHIFVSYDDEVSLEYKTAYLKQQGLAGAMFWHLGQDDQQGSLLRTLHRGLSQPTPPHVDLSGGIHY